MVERKKKGWKLPLRHFSVLSPAPSLLFDLSRNPEIVKSFLATSNTHFNASIDNPFNSKDFLRLSSKEWISDLGEWVEEWKENSSSEMNFVKNLSNFWDFVVHFYRRVTFSVKLNRKLACQLFQQIRFRDVC